MHVLGSLLGIVDSLNGCNYPICAHLSDPSRALTSHERWCDMGRLLRSKHSFLERDMQSKANCFTFLDAHILSKVAHNMCPGAAAAGPPHDG